MKKKIVVLLIAATLPLSTFGCSKDTEPVASENVVETEEQETELEQEIVEPEENENTVEPKEDTKYESLDTSEKDENLLEESESEPSVEDTDNMTNEEIEAELEDVPDIEVDTTGREAESGYTGVVNGIDMDYDWDGKGIDAYGQHFNTRGELCKYEDGIWDKIVEENPNTPEVEEFLQGLQNND